CSSPSSQVVDGSDSSSSFPARGAGPRLRRGLAGRYHRARLRSLQRESGALPPPGRGFVAASPSPLFSVETTRPPRFLGNPFVCMPRSSTPAGPLCQAIRLRWLPSAFATTSTPATTRLRGSITRPAHSLSTLRSAGHPTTTQDSLPARRPPLAGRDSHPLGSIMRFQLT